MGIATTAAIYNDKHAYVKHASMRDDQQLNVPHALAISMDGTELAVADRENYRVVLFDVVVDNAGGSDISLKEKQKLTFAVPSDYRTV